MVGYIFKNWLQVPHVLSHQNSTSGGGNHHASTNHHHGGESDAKRRHKSASEEGKVRVIMKIESVSFRMIKSDSGLNPWSLGTRECSWASRSRVTEPETGSISFPRFQFDQTIFFKDRDH